MEDNEDIVVVAGEHPDDYDKDIWWAMCNVCGTGYPIEGTDRELSDEHNNAIIEKWVSGHRCPAEPVSDQYWLEEHGDVNKHFGLDLDLL